MTLFSQTVELLFGLSSPLIGVVSAFKSRLPRSAILLLAFTARAPLFGALGSRLSSFGFDASPLASSRAALENVKGALAAKVFALGKQRAPLAPWHDGKSSAVPRATLFASLVSLARPATLVSLAWRLRRSGFVSFRGIQIVQSVSRPVDLFERGCSRARL